MGYTKDFLKGLGWIGAFRMGAKALVFFKVIFAYRYLSPREVGLFGLTAIALGLLEMLTETGINIVLIKDTKPISYYINTAWIVSILRGFLIGIVLLILAYVMPIFFHDQGLFSLMLLVSVIPVIKGFINPAISAYVKDLHFEKEAGLRIGLILIDSLMAVFLVSIFHDAQSLIFAMIIAAVAELLYSYLAIRPWPKLQFDRSVYTDIITPGKWINVASIIAFAEQNFDNIIVGRVLGATSLGYYQTAFNLTRSLIAEVGVAFAQVLLPIYGRMASDQTRLRRAVLKLFVPAGLLMLIPLIALNLHPIQELLIYFLKDKWRPALELLLPLSFCAWLTGMDSLINPIFLARDWIKTLVMLYAVGLGSMLVLMYWFTHTYGLMGAAQAVMFSRLLIQPLFIWKTYKVMQNSIEKT